jgi:hypothetical protein
LIEQFNSLNTNAGPIAGIKLVESTLNAGYLALDLLVGRGEFAHRRQFERDTREMPGLTLFSISPMKIADAWTELD